MVGAATADDDGHWQVKLDSHQAGGPFELTIAAGGQSRKYSDVLVGDVWVASGQSNMEWSVAAADNAEAEVAAADFPNIRIINAACDVLRIPREKVYNNLEKYGNTSAGSIPLALDEAMAEGRLKPGQLALLSGFGAGLTWGTALIRW